MTISQLGSAAMTTQPVALASGDGVCWLWLHAALDMAARSCPAAQDTVPARTREPADSRQNGRPATPRVATWTLAPVSGSIAAARAFTAAMMQRWGMTDRCDDATAVITELLANALRHALPQAASQSEDLAASPIRLGLADSGSFVVCAVVDPSPRTPVVRQPDWQDEAGRGLVVVAGLSDKWGYRTAPDGQGKVVWAAFTAQSAG